MMKKYLMTGIAAVAMGAAFTACSHDEITPMSQAELTEAQYEQAFIQKFGQPSPNQTWGFGNGTTRGAYPNGNMWADEGWNVPPVLTDGQKERVYKYFQSHQNLTYTSPGWTNYWIQQVYKGGTDPDNAFSKTTEEYASANGGIVVGGDHMDHLAAIDTDAKIFDHIFDFNNADNNDWEGRMLMTNSTTKTFGYFNSDGSLGHTDYTGLVDWTVIEEWGNDNNVGASLNDGWNRKFMGFDFEQVIDKNLYALNYVTGDTLYADYSGPATDGRVWDGNQVINTITGYDESWAPIYAEGYEVLIYDGKPVPFLSSDRNQYCGTPVEFKSDDEITITVDGQKCLNLPVFTNLLKQGYLPVAGSEKKTWVKVEGGADGYFSDWIVTLTEAKNSNTEIVYNGRVIAEDLTVREEGDFDFNDVVFDYAFNKPAGKTTIKLLAAGGTLPLYVGDHEVHEEFGESENTMINTGEGSKTVNKTPTFELDGTFDYNANNIEVKVIKKDNKGKPEVHTLRAIKGRAPSKINVGTDYIWCNERQDIDERFNGDFTLWVKGQKENFYK